MRLATNYFAEGAEDDYCDSEYDDDGRASVNE